MSLRGSITLECDQKGCHAELVIGDLELQIDVMKNGDLVIEGFADGWREDDHGLLWCPDCAAEKNPREKGDDDGREYGHPADALAGMERR